MPPTFWEGPSFSRSDTHATVCADACWRPTYAFVGPLAPASAAPVLAVTTTQTTTTALASSSPGQVAVRTAVDVAALQAVARQAGTDSRGRAYICTSDGTMLA